MPNQKSGFIKLCTASLALLLLSGCTEVLSFGVGFGAGFFTGQYYAKDEMKQKQGMAIAASQPTATYSSTTQVYTQPQTPAPMTMGGYGGASVPAYDYGAPPAYSAPAYSYAPAAAAYPAYDPVYSYSYAPPAAPVAPMAPAPAAAPMAPQNYSYAPAYDPYTAQLPPLAPTAPATNYAPSSPPLAGMPQQRYVPQS